VCFFILRAGASRLSCSGGGGGGGGGDGGAVGGDGWRCSGGGGDRRRWGATSVADGRWTVSKGQAMGSVQIEKGIKNKT
jgi:hypothetical protein